MIQVTSDIAIGENELKEEFIRSSGPGGQNINKVSTAVRLRFDVANSQSLPEEVRVRLISLASNRISEDGLLVIDARRFRTQWRNRKDATDRLVALIRNAAQRPKIRRKTRPTLASKICRLESKHRAADIKRARGPVNPENE